MNDIQLFNNPTFGDVRAFSISNEVWFDGKEVVKALGYKLGNHSASEYIKTHCDEDDYELLNSSSPRGSRDLDFDYKLLGRQGGCLINEYALIELTLSSPLPQAKQFRRWVTHEVIPSILKTGSYSIEQSERFNKLEDAVQQLQACLNPPKLHPLEELKQRLGSIESEREQVKILHRAMLEHDGFSVKEIIDYDLKIYTYRYDRLCKNGSNFWTMNRRVNSKNYSRVPDEPDFLE